MAHNSTDPRVPHALSLSLLDPASRKVLVRQFGVSDTKQLEQRLADKAFVRERIAALPPLCLILLEVLLESQGTLADRLWYRLTVERTQVSLDLFRLAQQRLFESGLVVGSTSAGGHVEQVAVLAAASGALYELLAGVSLPRDVPPAALTAKPAPARDVRDCVALSTLAAHRRLRLTQTRTPDRTSLKRLTKDLGVSVEDADVLLSRAHALGWLSQARDRVLPNVSVLLEAEQRIHPGCPEARFAAQISDQRWTSVEALKRSTGARMHLIMPLSSGDTLEHALAAQPCLQVIEHAGHSWVRRRAPGPLLGDGHVTPSFEVLLGPAASIGVVARVGLCCELMRVDHVLTFKLTPESVAAGLACGVAADELRAGLTAVSPHGLPENVRFMLEDWIAATRFVRVQQGLFVFADAEMVERLSAELRHDVISRPQPGVLELREEIAGATLEKALSKVKAVVRVNASPENAGAGGARSPDAALIAAATHEPDAELRSLVQRARESGTYDVEAAALEHSPADLMDGLAELARSQGAPKELFALFDKASELHRHALPTLEAWVERLPQQHKEPAEAVLALPVLVLPWLLLNDECRARVLKQARSFDLLVRSAEAQVRQPRALRAGADKVLAALARPAIQNAFVRATMAFTSDEGSDWDDDDDDDFTGKGPLDEALQSDLTRMADQHMPPAVRRAYQEREAVLKRQPRTGALSATRPSAVRELLARATQGERIVHVQFAQGGVLSVVVEALRRRGRDEVLHCVDLANVQARVLKLSDITAAQLDGVTSTSRE